MKKIAILLMAAMSLFFISCSSSKGGSKKNDLSPARYVEENSGFRLSFLTADIVEIRTNAKASPLACTYKYKAGKTGQIFGNNKKKADYTFTITPDGTVLLLKKAGDTQEVAMKKL